MDLQEFLNKAIADARNKRMDNSDQLTLGELIKKIEPIAANQKQIIEKYDNEATVCFDFADTFPTRIDSWRGSYSELALNWEAEGTEMQVSDFLKMLKDAVGKTFTGYKGGDFVMDEKTPVWVANHGKVGSTAVTEVVDNGYNVILMTGYREY